MITQRMRRASYAHLLLYSALLGAFGGLATAGFIYLLEQIKRLIWNNIPTALEIDSIYGWYVILVCTLGGLLLGVAIRFLGDYPKSLEATLAHYQKNRAFDYKHLWQTAVISLISLGFGASLGPEAALVTLIGGFVTLTSVRLKQASRVAYGADVVKKLPKPRRTLLGLVAAAVAWFVVRNLGTSDPYFTITNQPYSYDLTDLTWMIAVIAIGAFAGWLYNQVDVRAETWLGPARQQNIIFATTAGGLLVGLLAYINPEVLFSGHENLGSLLTSINVNGTWFFISLALLKILATTICLATGWKGGRFLPVLMIGAAAGLSIATITPVSAMFAMAIAMSAALTVVLKRPLVAGLLVACFFPLMLAPAIIITAFMVSRLKFPNLRRNVSPAVS